MLDNDVGNAIEGSVVKKSIYFVKAARRSAYGNDMMWFSCKHLVGGLELIPWNIYKVTFNDTNL